MADLEEAVLVKAHLRRTGRKHRKGVDLPDMVVFSIIFGLIVAAVYFLFEWVKAGGWILLSGGLIVFCVVFPLIRWRKYIFSGRVWTVPKSRIADRSWEKLKRDDYPLWLLHALYEAQYGHKTQTINKIGKDCVVSYGSKYEYRINLRDSGVPEYAARLSNLVASVSKRLR